MDELKRLVADILEFPGKECTLDEPDFEHAGHVNDWRNHVPDAVIAVWAQLSAEARMVAVLVADHAAQDEAWD